MSTAPHPGRKRHKKHQEEEHENHERWLVSYADMVTLLMCLFIVLFAMSQVDKAKFAALASGLSQSFGAPITVMPGNTPEGSPLDGLPAPVNIAAGIAPPPPGEPRRPAPRRRRGPPRPASPGPPRRRPPNGPSGSPPRRRAHT